jgi:hypothetical protein
MAHVSGVVEDDVEMASEGTVNVKDTKEPVYSTEVSVGCISFAANITLLAPYPVSRAGPLGLTLCS